MERLVLLAAGEQQLRIDKTRAAMALRGIDSAIITSNANIYYLTGRVFSGYVYLPADGSEPIYFVRRPVHLLDERAISVRKPESILSELKVRGLPLPERLGLELGRMTYTMAQRMMAALGVDHAEDVAPSLSMARAVKTPHEIRLLTVSGVKHERVYRKIAKAYRPGMTDLELQVEVERLLRLDGCLGQFRCAGDEMEIFMGNVIAGDNADNPSPYDFAMGGAGLSPSLPLGANGTVLRPGMTVMVDMNGNFTGYMTDMTRTYAIGQVDELARMAHQTSIDICRECAKAGRPGAEAKALYELGMDIAKAAGLEDYFMGHRQHASFIGHGVGIEINEWPVIAPRSKDILAEGNAIALEPKFVIPGVGAVGVENTYIVGAESMNSITRAPQELITLA
ncbi:MAG: Xaa-Pro peptidase family protein [Muribaculaceae bacterium]|nr:Xaa-Pro peptidase family protein [Muribaculaceae bacterium]